MQLIGVARDSRAMRSGLISHSCEIPIYGFYKIRTRDGKGDKEQGERRRGEENRVLSGGGPREGRVVAAFFGGCERKASQLRKLRLCSRLLRAYRPRKSIKTTGSGRHGRRRMARRGDSPETFTYVCRPCVTFHGRARLPSLRSANGASDLNGIGTRAHRSCLSSNAVSAAASRNDSSQTRRNAHDCPGSNRRGEQLIFQRVFACLRRSAENCASISGVAREAVAM